MTRQFRLRVVAVLAIGVASLMMYEESAEAYYDSLAVHYKSVASGVNPTNGCHGVGKILTSSPTQVTAECYSCNPGKSCNSTNFSEVHVSRSDGSNTGYAKTTATGSTGFGLVGTNPATIRLRMRP